MKSGKRTRRKMPVVTESPAVAGSAGHLVIRASAGTGKTFSLSSRYLLLLAQGATPESILATTFTRKAAGEILERILKRLAEGGASEKAAKNLARELSEGRAEPLTLTRAAVMTLLRRFCGSLHRLSISTLDSFFNRWALAFQPELGLPPALTLTDAMQPAARKITLAAMLATLAEEQAAALGDLVRALQRDRSGVPVAKMLMEIMDELREVFQESGPAAWNRLAEAGREPSPGDLARLGAGFLAEAGRFPNKSAAAQLTAHATRLRAGECEALLSASLFRAGAAGRYEYYRLPLPPSLAALVREAVEYLSWFVTQRCLEETRATAVILHRYLGHFERLRARQRLFFFDDLPRLLRRAATNGSLVIDLGYRLDARLRHLLLDEFQDTSPTQWRVIRPLAEEIVAGEEAAGTARSFFCVGDRKQAIYGWRGGCSAIFDEMQSDLRIGGDACRSLDLSWRSAPAVLEVVNRVFGTLAANRAFRPGEEEKPPEADYSGFALAWQKRFAPHTAANPERQGHVELRTSSAESEAEATSDRPHETQVTELVRGLADRHLEASLGVLVLTNRQAQTYLSLFRARGLAASGESGNPLFTEPAVAVCLTALHWADHPGDTFAALRLIESPLQPLLGIGSLAGAELEAAAARLRRQLIESGLPATLERWAAALAPAHDPGSQVASRLARFVELAEAFLPAEPLRAAEFIEFVVATPVEESSPARIRVMTVHKAKGLEFDIVVLPELTRRFDALQAAVFVHRDSPAGDIEAVYCAPLRDELIFNAELEAAHREELERRMDDNLCSLYVALTRARHALHMILPPLRPAKNRLGVGKPGRSDASFATLLRAALAPQDLDTAGARLLFSSGDPQWRPDRTMAAPLRPQPEVFDPARLRVDTAAPPRRTWRRVRPSRLASGATPARVLLSDGASEARERGTVLHRWLELIEWLDEPGGIPDEDTLFARARELSPGLDAEFLADCRRRFTAALRREEVAALLRRPAGVAPEQLELWRERPFAVKCGERLITGQFDRVVIERRGGRTPLATLIDFKTDLIDSPDAFEKRMMHYRPQMEAYREALARLLGLRPADVSALFLFLEHGAVKVE